MPTRTTRSEGLTSTAAASRAALAGAIAAIAIGAWACGWQGLVGSGKVVSQTLSVPTFDRIHASEAFRVHLTAGPTVSVTVRFNENLRNDLDASVSGGELRLALRPNVSIVRATLEAEVSLPRLSRLELDGASEAQLEAGIDASTVDVVESGASRVAGSLKSDRATVDVSGASVLQVDGAADQLVAHGSGASKLHLADLSAQSLSIELSGASSAEVAVSTTISADVSGASRLRYKGMPTFNKRSEEGASAIEPL